mmetsp:Transcript_25866/g.61337  ORF Transcript_25866/g.61337 Transcript_25866/m.61337 type:complete len:284 (+) Transcript_25866:125-976(+)
MRSRRSANRVWVVGPPDLDIWAEEGGQNLVFFVVERVDRLSKHELPRFLHLGQRVLDRFAEQRQVVAKNEEEDEDGVEELRLSFRARKDRVSLVREGFHHQAEPLGHIPLEVLLEKCDVDVRAELLCALRSEVDALEAIWSVAVNLQPQRLVVGKSVARVSPQHALEGVDVSVDEEEQPAARCLRLRLHRAVCRVLAPRTAHAVHDAVVLLVPSVRAGLDAQPSPIPDRKVRVRQPLLQLLDRPHQTWLAHAGEAVVEDKLARQTRERQCLEHAARGQIDHWR